MEPLIISCRERFPKITDHRRVITRIRTFCKRLVHFCWVWEILTASIPICAAVALVTVLLNTDERQQAPIQIGSVEVSLNAIVAAIATILKTSLNVTIEDPKNQGAWNWFDNMKGVRKSASKPFEGPGYIWECVCRLMVESEAHMAGRGRYDSKPGLSTLVDNGVRATRTLVALGAVQFCYEQYLRPRLDHIQRRRESQANVPETYVLQQRKTPSGGDSLWEIGRVQRFS
jgi:hypothetical protein